MDAVGFGIIMPVLPQLVMEVGRIDLPRAIEVGAWIGLVMAVATFLASPVLGNLSDHFGRRRICCSRSAAVDYVLLTIIETLPWLFVARALSGIFGGSYAAAQAAIADITAPSAPAISALLAQHSVSVSLPAPRSAVSWARSPARAVRRRRDPCRGEYALWLFHLSRNATRERRRTFDWRRANPLGAWRTMRALPGMDGVAGVLVLWQIASLVYR